MNLKKLTLTYLSAYLVGGGLGLSLAPGIALNLLQSNQEYGDVMPRVAGLFMVVLGTLIGAFVVRSDYSYYSLTILVRTGIVGFLFVLYLIDRDPMFIVLEAIVLVGLIPSYFVLASERSNSA